MKRTVVWLAAAAVAVAGAPAPAAAATAGAATRWVIQRTPGRAVPGNQLNGVSCTSAEACTAVGDSGPFAGLAGARAPVTAGAGTATLAERWDGTRWSIQPTPNPAGGAVLLGVSCSSTRECTAVGSEQAGSKILALAERWNGSSWSIQPTPSPASAVVSELLGVSCPAPDECVAVGDSYGSSGAVSGFAERWNGSLWAIARLVRAARASETFLRSVSCSSASGCTAVGSFQLTSTSFPLALRWTGTLWRQQAAPGTGELLAVSCPALSRCTAVGDRPKGDRGQSQTLAMGWDGGSWATQAAPGLRGASQGILQGVSCPTVTSCTAAGWAALSRDVTLAEHWNGATWTAQVTPNPSGSQASFLSGVWCGSPVTCRASGSYVVPAGSKTLAESE